MKNNFEDKEENLTTYLTTEELSCLVNLPQRSVPGISVIDYSVNFSLTPQKFEKTDKIIDVGHLVYSGSSSNINVKKNLFPQINKNIKEQQQNQKGNC